MDKNLRYSLEILFHRTSPLSVLKHFLNKEKRNDYYKDSYNYSFERRMMNEYEFLSQNEIENISNLLKGLDDNGGCGVFTTIIEFANSTLREVNGQPSIKFEELLRFRDTTHSIGSNIFISAFLANLDYKRGKRRVYFDYPTAIPTDNIRIQNMLKEGLSENHFHIKGSTPAFMLSWICLMNNVKRRKKSFDKMNLKKESLNSDMLYVDMDEGESYYSLVLKAAAIRLFLARKLNGSYNLEDPKTESDTIEFFDFLQYDDDLTSVNSNDLQSKIDTYKRIFGNNIEGYRSCMDYYIKNTKDSKSSNIIFSGERRFLYDMFYAIISGDKKVKPYVDLFYAYILISSWFRGELVQNNNRTGFSNFSEYQDRKEIFIEGYKNYKKAIIAIALESNLNEPHIKSIEGRFSPKAQGMKIRQQIAGFDKIVNIEKYGKNKERLFYVAHFPKTIDKKYKYLECRHYLLRKDVKHRALNISYIRERRSPEAYRLLGIDACSNEIGCRPEVFSQPFRYLKNHSVEQNILTTEDKVPSQLHITYHAGEDFLDVADGLRAINEAYNFLDMSQGDRLGHALALGIDPEQWYKSKNYRIIIPKQDLLDNVAWLIYKLSQYGYSNTSIIYELKSTYKANFLHIYQQSMRFQEKDYYVDPDIYIDSWKLRGDDPYLYLDCEDHDEYIKNIKYDYLYPYFKYNVYAKNKPCDEKLNAIRENNIIAYKLMHYYHFNEDVRKRGAECTEYKISKQYIKAVRIIQEKMRFELAEDGIGIECNPSSNYLIGTFKRYDQHPMINFNNKGLKVDEKNAKMFISINTDDLGVFDTSLENEYALIACALQKVEDDNGNKVYCPSDIYDYLDNIRRMGIEQSFGYNN